MHNNNSLSMWLKYLEKIDKKVIFNLSKLKFIAKKLNLLNSKSFFFTVAGTNGKGTTCAMLETLLLNSGYQVGLYTSPHLVNYLERVRVNGSILDPEEHISSFKYIDLVRYSHLLSYFEFITLTALLLFQKKSLDIIILEVGLGGRLDATNIIDSNLSIITNIGIDHTSVLGHNRLSIAREKSGVFRKNKISVIGEIDIPDSMIKIAKEKKAILKKINKDWFWNKKNHYWNFIHPDIELFNLPLTDIPLSNTAIALSALYYAGFKITEDIIRRSISSVKLPGRFQIISTYPLIIVDVAHNPDASLHLFEKIKSFDITGKIYALVGMLKDKDISGIIRPFKKIINYWYAAPLKTKRTATSEKLKEKLPLDNTKVLNSIDEAYKTVQLSLKKQDAVLVFGSFLTVSEFISAKNIEDEIDTSKI